MRRLILVFMVLVTAGGCSPYGAVHKKPQDFAKLCESVAPGAAETAGTNETDTANLKPRLIAPGMQITVNVTEDASLKRTYIVSPGCALDVAAAGRISVCGLT